MTASIANGSALGCQRAAIRAGASRAVRAPLACATSSLHIALVSRRNASASVARSTYQLPLSISASSCRAAQHENPA